MATERVAPTKYIHEKPGDKTVFFCGVPLDMKRLASEQGFDYSYITRVFAGNRLPTTIYGEKLAAALGMTWPDLYLELKKIQID